MFVLFIVVAAVVVVSAGVFPLLRSLRDGASENLQEISRVRLPVEDCGLRKERWEEGGVVRRLVPLIFRSREVSGGGAK